MNNNENVKALHYWLPQKVHYYGGRYHSTGSSWLIPKQVTPIRTREYKRAHTGVNTHTRQRVLIDPSQKSQDGSDKYPTIHHFVPEIYTHVHISVTKWCVVGYGIGVIRAKGPCQYTHLSINEITIEIAEIIYSYHQSWTNKHDVLCNHNTPKGLFRFFTPCCVLWWLHLYESILISSLSQCQRNNSDE